MKFLSLHALPCSVIMLFALCHWIAKIKKMRKILHTSYTTHIRPYIITHINTLIMTTIFVL